MDLAALTLSALRILPTTSVLADVHAADRDTVVVGHGIFTGCGRRGRWRDRDRELRVRAARPEEAAGSVRCPRVAKLSSHVWWSPLPGATRPRMRPCRCHRAEGATVHRRVSAGLLAGVFLLSLLPVATAARSAEPDPAPSGAPRWAHEASVYHVFVDRFDDGDPSSNVDVDTTLSFDEALKDWMGGDLAGVEERLDHIEDLGFDTIWLGPVYDGKYFHGYHPADFLNVDPNFGTNAQLKQLVEAVHARDMRIVYDFVPNHTSDEHPWFQDAIEEVDGAPRCQDSAFYAYYRFNEDCSDYRSFAGIAELPKLDLMSPDGPAARYLLDEVVPFYLEVIGFDGFRIDHAQGPGSDDPRGPDDNQLFLAALRDVAAGMDGDKYLFGEVWSPREQIASYVGVLDGALNFPLHDALTATLAGDASLADFDKTVRTDLGTYADGFVLTSFLDSHDVQRFVFQAGNDAAARERLKLAFTAQFTLPGSPVVYNGTDIGMGQTANTEAPGGGWV
jgi:cyclomaltodextrinase / maltogenic alpha-amylase / neopullulanase